ncbi:MAG: sugar transferase [Muribaculaceae bacterium]
MKGEGTRRLQYILSDYITTNIGWLVFNVVRYLSLPPVNEVSTMRNFLLHDTNILLGQLLFPIMMVVLYALSGFYNRPGVKSRIDQLGNTIGVSLIGMLLIFFTALINDDVPERLRNYELMAILWALLSGPALIGRALINNIRRGELRRGIGVFNALMLGNNKAARSLAERIERHPHCSEFRVVSFIDPKASPQAIAAEAARLDASVIIIGNGASVESNRPLFNSLLLTGLDIYVPADNYRLAGNSPSIRSVVSEPLINITAANISPATANLKRVGDIFVSAIALVLLLPVFAIIAIAIKSDSSGSVFYTQERIGRHRKPFKIIKFRTMVADAEAAGPALSSTNDPRITSVGRFLRKYRIDELPQFWNVLRGDMSLVGPRPERQFYEDQIISIAPHYILLHQVRPGITSWGMVKYGYAGSVDQMVERLRYDILYLENVSLSVDLKILFYTVRTVVTGQGI